MEIVHIVYLISTPIVSTIYPYPYILFIEFGPLGRTLTAENIGNQEMQLNIRKRIIFLTLRITPVGQCNLQRNFSFGTGSSLSLEAKITLPTQQRK